MTLTGYIRFPEAAGVLTPAENIAKRLWFTRDHLAMARALGWGEVAPFYIDLEPPVPASGIPKPGPLDVHLKDDHLQYAITWFALAGAVVIAFGRGGASADRGDGDGDDDVNTHFPCALPVTLADIEAAADVLAGFVKRTSFERSRTLSDITGASVWLKFENLQFTATFKERGALNRLSALSADERRRGVIAASAGNHAQGVAYHAARLSIPATIFVPLGTPTVKIENTRRHGATVIEGGATLEEAASAGHRAWPRRGLDVHPSLRRSPDHRRSGHHRARDARCGA